MKRIPLSERRLPDYTKGEEITNMVTHIVGGALGVVATVLCPIVGAWHHSAWAIVSGLVYALSMLTLYTISSIYHGLSPHVFGKRVMQVLDHCSIFLLIAGTYTPLVLCPIREYDPALGWVLFGVVWAAAALGITLNAIDLKKYEGFSMACYLLMGWCIVFRIQLVRLLVGPTGFALLLWGGIAYTVGVVLYVLGRKRRYAHSAFHVFVVIGSLLHFLCVILYVL